MLSDISDRVRFAHRRFVHYNLTNFMAVLLGYAVSGEHTLEEYYERLQPFANAFMALFGRDRLSARSTLSRFLAALNQPVVEALRKVFREDLCAREDNHHHMEPELLFTLFPTSWRLVLQACDTSPGGPFSVLFVR